MGYDILEMKTIAKTLNNRTFTDYYYRLMLIARSVFKWNNLPNGISEKWIEKWLFTEGECLFYKDPEKGFMVAKCTESGSLNYYDEPTELHPYGTNYIGKSLENNTECVLICNNDCRIPTAPSIQLFALRLAEISRTIDVNISAQKTPVVVLCSDKQKLSMKKAFQSVAENEPVIYGEKNGLDMDSIKVLDTDAPVVFPQLQIQKHAIWNECMTFLGINNANMDKRERLVADEVEANDDQIESSRNVMLRAREEACERINELFGLNISVELRKQEEEKEEEEEIDGGEQNE